MNRFGIGVFALEYEKVIDIVDTVNNGKKAIDVAKELGISKDTFSRRLSEVGYKFNNRLKKYEYVGEVSEKNQVDGRICSELFQKKVRRNAVKRPTVVGQKSEDVRIKVVEKEAKVNDLSFSEDEIKSLKKLIKIQQSDQSKILFDLMELPFSGKTIKKTVLGRDDLLDDFEKFAEKITVNNKMITKNMLIELALYEFMTKYNKN
ncbi:TPA: hypothetical protein QCN67_005603 [Bacillus thuringiensis]|uniref:hypothetical protein n=1 Tax=Bacillus thuringiensis TaxID=1428 RepID=UPI00111CE3A8|nr:hypothetical protein [Bacillus thuringiensis]MED3102292.1 hypothetical protein [Bacillus thuringiensis]MRA99925.1 hypothetical protein [Bacillus thuringiensis]UEL01404.1 hypothetical protein K8Z23_30760 [Bacillus thuringiensis]WMR09782.1 hypothetical protein RCI28_29105 [Bacillus thuringiensis serovar tenebrionis]WMR16332.1 hypothetical protein RCI27_31965 [Bacillus thuringiensis serovar tenebrionis]